MIKDHHRRSSAAENFVDPMFVVPIFRDLLIRAVEIDIEVDRRIAGVVVQKGQSFLAFADAQQQLRVDEKTFRTLVDIRGLGIEQRIGGGLDRSFWLSDRFLFRLRLARIFRRLLFAFARDRGALALGLTLLARIGHRQQSGQRQNDDPCPPHDSMELVVLSSFAGTWPSRIRFKPSRLNAGGMSLRRKCPGSRRAWRLRLIKIPSRCASNLTSPSA